MFKYLNQLLNKEYCYALIFCLQVYYERPKSSALLETDVDTSVPSVPPRHAKSEVFLETDFDSPFHKPHDMSTFQPLSKSQPLETAM